MKMAYVQQISAGLKEGLAECGFAAKRDQLILTVNAEIVGTVSLNIASHRSDGLVGVAPIIGIESVSIRSMLGELIKLKHGAPQPSLTSAIGYLMPEARFLEWLFDPKEPVDQRGELVRMCMAIKQYGMEFLRERGSIEEIVRCLETLRFSFKERAIYHLPVAYRVTGAEERARDYVHRGLLEMEGRSDVASQDYRGFAKKFLSVV